MGDYISRDEVHAQIDRALCCGLPYHRTIDEIPAADVVEVVRCKDCIHYIGYRQDCGLYAVGKSNGLENPQPEEFCSRGERREPNDG